MRVCVYFILAKYGDRMLRLLRADHVAKAERHRYITPTATWTLTEVAQSAVRRVWPRSETQLSI